MSQQNTDKQGGGKPPPVGSQNGGRKQSHSNNTNTNSDNEKCAKCTKIMVDANEEAFSCSFCSEYCCQPCIGMTKSQLSAFQKLELRSDIMWACDKCSEIVQSLKVNTDLLSKIREELTTKIGNMHKDITAAVLNVSKSITNLDQSLKKSFSTSTEKVVATVAQNCQSTSKKLSDSVLSTENKMINTFAEALKKGNTEQIDKCKGAIKDAISEQVNEQAIDNMGTFKTIMQEQNKERIKEDRDKEERQKNIIIYKSTETEGNNRDIRIANDKQTIDSILDHLGIQVEIKAFFRLGRFDNEKHKEGKIRPLKVLLQSKEDRDQVMRNLFKLNSSDNPSIKETHIGYDLNENQRDIVTEKINEAKALTNSQPDYFWKVRGPPWALWLKREKKRQPLADAISVTNLSQM
jgi:hypothetical protein